MSELATMPRHNLGESASSGSVLIIDDEPIARQILREEGLRVDSRDEKSDFFLHEGAVQVI